MLKYNTFLLLFIASIAAFVVFMVFYLQGFFSLVMNREHFVGNENPAAIFSIIFNPGVIISFIVMAFCGLALRILGIVAVAKNKTVSDGEKALWIVGFVLMGFVTAIIFLIMAKGKKFVE
ncbi:MAG: hypothetical protein IPP72_19640 [Chitinophagaceae bacterium]|nr:hypothetical protein [Chitinophagaceae bacterium]